MSGVDTTRREAVRIVVATMAYLLGAGLVTLLPDGGVDGGLLVVGAATWSCAYGFAVRHFVALLVPSIPSILCMGMFFAGETSYDSHPLVYPLFAGIAALVLVAPTLFGVFLGRAGEEE